MKYEEEKRREDRIDNGKASLSQGIILEINEWFMTTSNDMNGRNSDGEDKLWIEVDTLAPYQVDREGSRKSRLYLLLFSRLFSRINKRWRSLAGLSLAPLQVE